MPVSLIATVLNEGSEIRRLMESIAAQTRQPDEVIICDGGSTDNTAAVLGEYADRLPPTRFPTTLRPARNAGTT